MSGNSKNLAARDKYLKWSKGDDKSNPKRHTGSAAGHQRKAKHKTQHETTMTDQITSPPYARRQSPESTVSSSKTNSHQSTTRTRRRPTTPEIAEKFLPFV